MTNRLPRLLKFSAVLRRILRLEAVVQRAKGPVQGSAGLFLTSGTMSSQACNHDAQFLSCLLSLTINSSPAFRKRFVAHASRNWFPFSMPLSVLLCRQGTEVSTQVMQSRPVPIISPVPVRSADLFSPTISYLAQAPNCAGLHFAVLAITP